MPAFCCSVWWCFRRIAILFMMLAAACVSAQEEGFDAPETTDPVTAASPEGRAPGEKAAEETGLASVYSDVFQDHRTASGEIYDREKLTAAHKTLPFGTRVKVTHSRSRRTVVVRINDRGPHLPGRVIDLSPRAARAIGISTRGMGRVELQILEQPRCVAGNSKRRRIGRCSPGDPQGSQPLGQTPEGGE